MACSDSEAHRFAAQSMQRGGVVAFPTDTVYGLGTAFDSTEGIARLYAVKGRLADKAIPVLIGALDQLELLAHELPEDAMALAARYWPGALTLVLQRRHTVLPELAPGRSSLGIRMTNHPVVQSLIALTGVPLACSSANRSGEPPARSAEGVASQFSEGLAAILDGGLSSGGVPSTVVDFTAQPPRILREGAISRAALAAMLAHGLT